MHPEINLILGSRIIEVGAYRFFLLLAALVAILSAYLVAVRRGLPQGRVLACLTLMAIAAPIGARIMYSLLNWKVSLIEPEKITSLQPIGFSLYGGLMLAAAVGLVVGRIMRLELWRLADSFTPALGLGIAVARIGCFLNGCCFGIPTSLPWGVVFPPGSPADTYQRTIGYLFSHFQSMPGVSAVHPTQIYELTAGLLGASLALWLLQKKSFDGATFLFFAIFFTLFRYFNSFLRVSESASSMPEFFYPVFYSLLVLASVILFNERRRDDIRKREACTRLVIGKP